MKYRKKDFSKKTTENEFNSSGLQQDWEEEVWSDKKKKSDRNDGDKTSKWYEEFSATPEQQKTLSSEEVVVLREEASQVLKDETAFYNSNKEKRKQNSDQAWIKTVLQKGTASDKVAAHVLKIQDSPVFNLSSLITLVNMIKISKNDFTFVIDALAELFLSDLLPPNLKLRPFEKQPLDRLLELTSGNAITRRRRLAFWAFEDELKKLYIQFIQSLNVIARDSVEANKEKVISVLYKLLASHPEQEDVILKLVVNKLGDPSRKVASKVIYSLTQLLRAHQGMKQVVMNEVERLLFRPNINTKAQYYAICFLSQFHFTINDDQVACNIISIYFAFFKACIKKGDVNSRMLGSLLMGLNRAYPYAKKKIDTLSDHINTLYKLVHLANFNISLQCLSILFQICDSSEDRFYCVLYKKLSDLQLATSAHQAMFINLLYRALTNDSNIGRVKTFIKRILQLCGLMPVPLTCGLLYLVSQLIHKRKLLSANVLRVQPIDEKYGVEGDEEEYYRDVDSSGVKEKNDEKMIESNNKADEDIKVKNVKEYDANVNEGKCNNSEYHKKEVRKPNASWYHSVFQKQKHGFDPLVRNPAFAGGESAVYTELSLLTRHFHPTVALFASQILEDEVITYTGDPLVDFTLVRFVERFVFKNPKKVTPGSEIKGPDPVLAQRKYYMPTGAKALASNSKLYLEQNEKDVPVDELFLYRYLHQRQQLGYQVIKKERDDDSDVDSVASEEFEEMLDSIMSKKSSFNFADDVCDNLSNKTAKKNKKKYDEDDDVDEDADVESDLEGEDDIDEEDFEKDNNELDDDNDSNIDLSDVDDSDAEVIDFNDSEEDEDEGDASSGSKRNKKGSKLNLKKLRKNVSDLFAPAEEFSEMLEEAGTSYKVGSAHALSNKDKAATRQLEWEMKRNDWISGNKRRSSNNNYKKGKRRKIK